MTNLLSRFCRAKAFLLLETMLGVTIFAIGMLALAQAMQHCLDAEMIRRQNQLAAKVLENRMAEIGGSAVEVNDQELVTAMEGRYEGITLRQWREELNLTDENGATLTGLYTVHLKAEWQGPVGPEFREISFYIYREE